METTETKNRATRRQDAKWERGAPMRALKSKAFNDHERNKSLRLAGIEKRHEANRKASAKRRAEKKSKN